ncbi:MAG TPA: helix-turn-helix transcriptional regulator [Kofleriaceae bacterium]|nr:helix-turn-helix transcriptional regulator [Kofleriaceae bacterium]
MNSVEELVGRRIREKRKLAGFTQAQLAERVRVCNETVCRLETGKCLPSLYTIERIARALQIELRDLFRTPKTTSPEDLAIDRLVFTMRRRSVDEIECVIDVATRIFEHTRVQHAVDTKRAKRNG